MITFRKKDDVYLEFSSSDRGELRMFSDYFTFEVEGARFTPAFRNKIWDGKIRLANLRTNTVYMGLVDDIAKFSKDMDIDVEFEGSKYDFPGLDTNINDNILDGFLKSLNPHSKGQQIIPHDYQVRAFKEAITKQRCLILSPTASGKSLIIYALMRWYREVHNRKILIVVPTISLVSQLKADFDDYSNNSFTDVHCISAGVEKNTDKRVVITTWQSVFRQPAGWFAQFGSVVVDEVHFAEAKSIQQIMNNLLVCPDRVGLTGTLKDCKTNQLVLKGLFGSVRKMITTKELMERGQISQLDIRVVNLEYEKEDTKLVKGMSYQEEIDFLCKHQKRNELVAKMARRLEGNTLVIFGRIEHGKMIYDNLGDVEGKEIFYVAGSTKGEDREAVRTFAENNNVIIVASLGVFSTGINIKNLHNLVFAHPTKSKIKVLQSIGRVLRKSSDGKPATVFDIVDNLKHGQRENFALKHANERFKQYSNEKFNIKINTVKL